MSNFRKFFFVNALISLFALSAFATEVKPGGPSNPASLRAVNWEELQGRCAHPEQYDIQVAPANIKLVCQDTQVSWVPGAPGEVPLTGSRKIKTEVLSTKFHVQ